MGGGVPSSLKLPLLLWTIGEGGGLGNLETPLATPLFRLQDLPTAYVYGWPWPRSRSQNQRLKLGNLPNMWTWLNSNSYIKLSIAFETGFCISFDSTESIHLVISTILWFADISKWIADIINWIGEITKWNSDIKKWIRDISNSFFDITKSEYTGKSHLPRRHTWAKFSKSNIPLSGVSNFNGTASMVSMVSKPGK